MDIKMKKLYAGAVIYLYLAVAVFLAGWLKPLYAIVSCLAMGIGVYLGIYAWKQEKEEIIRVEKSTLLIGLAIILFMCWHTGIGAFTGQTSDWNKHNAVLHDLIERRWPVIYSTQYGDSMLSYYIGYYLLPAAAGKMTGSFRSAELTELVWSAAGIGMVWMLLVHLCHAEGRGRQLAVLGLLFLYGGLLALGQTVCLKLYPESYCSGSNEWMNPESVVVQYTANWFLLKWVPAQAIAAWMATALVLLKKHKVETYVVIGLPVLLYSGFAMVGLAVLMAVLAVFAIKKEGKNALRRIFSLSNLILTLGVGGILLLYFWGNLSGGKPEELSFHLLNYGKKKFFYFVFCFFMFGYYAILLYKENKKNVIYWATVAALCAYPLFRMGLYNDFTMRVGIPALFMLMVLMLRFLLDSPYRREEEAYRSLLVRKTLAAAGLAVGMMYPLLNVWEGITKNEIGGIYRSDHYLTLEEYANPLDDGVDVDLRYNYYSYDLEHDVFYQYLAK